MLTEGQRVRVGRTGRVAEVVATGDELLLGLPETGLVLVRYTGPCSIVTHPYGKTYIVEGRTLNVYEDVSDLTADPCVACDGSGFAPEHAESGPDGMCLACQGHGKERP